MKKSSYSPKVLELIAKEVGGHFTGDEIVKMLMGFGMAREIIQYPNTKWWTVNEAFKYIKANYEAPDDSISKLVMDFLHPLNHNLNEEKAERLANQVEKFLKYDNFYIQDTGTEYLIFSDEEMEEMHSSSPAEIAQQKVKSEDTKKLDEQKIKDGKDAIKKLRDNHQAYMDVIEIFCQNSKKPTKELNDAYLFLSKKIETAISQLNLQYNRITFYKPFKNDLYTAEIEWNGTGAFGEIILGPRLSWDAVRPYLHRVHSEISKVFNISEEDSQMTDDEKRLEEITSLISEKRIQKPIPKVTKEPTEIRIVGIPDLNIKNVEDNTIVKGKKRIHLPKFKATDWAKITIRFINERDVLITADKKQTQSDYEALGFADDKKKKPNTAWAFLLGLSKSNGETVKLQKPIPDTIRQHKTSLAQKLKAIFKNETDPFYDSTETQTYKIKIQLIPPQASEEKEDRYGTQEYLKDTMTEEYDK